MNLAQIIDPHDPSSVAIIDDHQVVTYGELRSRVAAMHAHLTSIGISAGDHVAVACGNEVGFVVAALGALRAGCAVAPINPHTPINELLRKVEPLQAAAVVVGKNARAIIDNDERFGLTIVDMHDVATSVDDEPATVEVDADATAFLLSTSGVSGTPKVAMLSHENLAHVQRSIVGDGPQQLTADDVSLAVLPPAHILGLNIVVLSTLRAGARLVMQWRFDVDESLRLVREHQVTQLVGAPPMWQRWAAADAPADSMASVRFARSGAASLPADVFERIREHCGVEVRQGYGLTESSAAVSSGRGHDVRVTSVGKPLPGLEMVLVNEQGDPVDIGDMGEVVVRGPSIFKGYLNDVEATESVLTPDGWLWTGDVGVFDEDGYLYLVDRIKDIIIVSGFNVYPAEVEDVLMRCPGVKGALVVGGAHGATGETVIAHVSGEVTVEELEAFAASHLARYKRPTEYHLVEELPQTDAGKRVRREVR